MCCVILVSWASLCPFLPSRPLFPALSLSFALFPHLSLLPLHFFVFLAFSRPLGFPSNERIPGKEGSIRPWASPADPAPSCDLPACWSPSRLPSSPPQSLSPPLSPRDPPEAPLLKVPSPSRHHPSLADLSLPGGLPFGQLGERSWLLEEGPGSLRASNWVFLCEGLGSLGTLGCPATEGGVCEQFPLSFVFHTSFYTSRSCSLWENTGMPTVE